MATRTSKARSTVHSSGGRVRRQPRYPDDRAGGFASLPRDSFANDNVRAARRLARDVAYIMLNGADECQVAGAERPEAVPRRRRFSR
jgi:hypothetical protein